MTIPLPWVHVNHSARRVPLDQRRFRAVPSDAPDQRAPRTMLSLRAAVASNTTVQHTVSTELTQPAHDSTRFGECSANGDAECAPATLMEGVGLGGTRGDEWACR